MKKFATVLLLMVLFVGLGCSKSGPAGPAGATGKNGANGTDGKDGINGKDGSTILSGKGSPAAAVGQTGDFYLDLTNNRLYGPKVSAGWGTGFNLKGQDGKDGTNGKDGSNGKDGAQILNGEGYPSADIGNIGDFYIDLNDFTLYGPKYSNTDWGMSGIMLRGINGTNGTDGRDGIDGKDGKDANVRTYIISNPWNYYYTDVPTMGLFRFIIQGNFSITQQEADYGLVLVYMECSWSENSTSWLMAGTNLGSFTSNFISASEVVENYGTVNGVYLTTTNKLNGSSGWTSQEDAQATTKISRVKIVVISPSTLYIMAKKGVDTKNVRAVANYINQR